MSSATFPTPPGALLYTGKLRFAERDPYLVDSITAGLTCNRPPVKLTLALGLVSTLYNKGICISCGLFYHFRALVIRETFCLTLENEKLADGDPCFLRRPPLIFTSCVWCLEDAMPTNIWQLGAASPRSAHCRSSVTGYGNRWPY